jgi:hypothetical protein
MDKGKDPPAEGAQPAPDPHRSQREARLAKALRDNLRRRKAPPRAAADPPSGD